MEGMCDPHHEHSPNWTAGAGSAPAGHAPGPPPSCTCPTQPRGTHRPGSATLPSPLYISQELAPTAEHRHPAVGCHGLHSGKAASAANNSQRQVSWGAHGKFQLFAECLQWQGQVITPRESDAQCHRYAAPGVSLAVQHSASALLMDWLYSQIPRCLGSVMVGCGSGSVFCTHPGASWHCRCLTLFFSLLSS